MDSDPLFKKGESRLHCAKRWCWRAEQAEAKVTDLESINAALRSRVEEAIECFTIECDCCGGVAASWAASDGDSLECGCTGSISACSEISPWANAEDCECGGKGYPKSGEVE